LVFYDNPFIAGAEQFAAAALVMFSAVRPQLTQSTDGAVRYQLNMHLSPPPSEYGHVDMAFEYSAAEMNNIILARELSEAGEQSPAGLVEDARLSTTAWFYLAHHDGDPEEVSQQLTKKVFGLGLLGPAPASVDVDVISRRSSRGEQVGGVSRAQLRVGVEESLSVSAVHSVDWAQAAQRVHDLGCELAQLAGGSRPPALQLEDLLL
jgi:hypothetical protein